MRIKILLMVFWHREFYIHVLILCLESLLALPVGSRIATGLKILIIRKSDMAHAVLSRLYTDNLDKRIDYHAVSNLALPCTELQFSDVKYAWSCCVPLLCWYCLSGFRSNRWLSVVTGRPRVSLSLSLPPFFSDTWSSVCSSTFIKDRYETN